MRLDSIPGRLIPCRQPEGRAGGREDVRARDLVSVIREVEGEVEVEGDMVSVLYLVSLKGKEGL